jgi:NAD(P)-dependent dehydrogenase (short-subunit alcohol dehydrogenase family)
MKKILITGATDGIGLETARKLKTLGHTVLIHGRNIEKLDKVSKELDVESFKADLSSLTETRKFANIVFKDHKDIDVLINNAGVFKTSNPRTEDGFDVRFVVNTFAPYLLTKILLPNLKNGRVLNLSSAAQSKVDFEAMLGKVELDVFEAYAQSKLAITMWSRQMALDLGVEGPCIICVNPGSLLATNMVREGFDIPGNDINIGVNILVGLALDSEHANHSGEYYDNDNTVYADPQADGLDSDKAKYIMKIIDDITS